MTNEQVKLNLHIAREPEGHADSQSGDGDDQDSDVEAEREQIERAGPANAPHLCMHRLKKVYGHGASAKVAVRDLSVGVQMDECLCLLGANGAGKTSTMQILSGLVSASGGTARVAGKSIYSSLHDIFATLGVCWQADTLWDLLTAREHLLLACRLRAVPPPHPWSMRSCSTLASCPGPTSLYKSTRAAPGASSVSPSHLSATPPRCSWTNLRRALILSASASYGPSSGGRARGVPCC